MIIKIIKMILAFVFVIFFGGLYFCSVAITDFKNVIFPRLYSRLKYFIFKEQKNEIDININAISYHKTSKRHSFMTGFKSKKVVFSNEFFIFD